MVELFQEPSVSEGAAVEALVPEGVASFSSVRLPHSNGIWLKAAMLPVCAVAPLTADSSCSKPSRSGGGAPAGLRWSFKHLDLMD